MAQIPEPNKDFEQVQDGLRGRKKALRRKEILTRARQLFEREGVDATTMSAIADKAGISPPTVFNYFGSKENILMALLFEGTADRRELHLRAPRKTDCGFAEVLGDLMCECTENTMKIAGKRVWRYAEATNIRRPDTEFRSQFSHSDAELHKLFVAYLNAYDLVLRNKANPDADFLASLFYDRWTARYFEFIKVDEMTMAEHEIQLRDDAGRMVTLLFDDRFATNSPLKKRA